MRRKTIGILMVFGILALAGCGASTRNHLGEVPASEQQKMPWHSVWSVKASSGYERVSPLSPVVFNQVVYVADSKGQILAESLDTGKIEWKSSIGDNVTAGLGLSSDLVLLGSKAATLYALDKSSGTVRWTVPLSSVLLSKPVTDESRVYIRTNDNSVSAFSLDSGTLLWVLEQSQPSLIFQGGASPALWGSLLLVGTNDGKLVAIDKNNGTVLWEKVIADPKGRTEVERMVDVVADVQVVGSKALVATYQGRMALIDLETEALLWQRDFSVYQNFSVNAEAIYLVDTSNTLWALDLRSGATLWQQEALKDRQPSGPLGLGSVVVVLDKGGMLYWLDPSDGRLLSSQQLEDSFVLAPYRVNDGAFLAYGEHGRLFYWMK